MNVFLLYCDTKQNPPDYYLGGLFISMKLPYCVYVLQSEKDLLLYHGYTTNLEKRLVYHHAGHTKSTAPRRPLRLVFCEFFLNKSDAIRREKYLKTSQGKRMLKLMIRDTLKEVDYSRI